jgi:predicted nucleic acid-binding protein
VLDEAQRIKNWATKTALTVKRLDPPYRLVLTGTPMEHRLDELVSLVEWVDNFALEPKWRLASWHTTPVEGKTEIGGARNLDTLRTRLAPAWSVASVTRCCRSRRGPTRGSPIVVQLSIMPALATYVVADTSAILAVLLDEPEKEAVVEATKGCVLCAPASIRWEVGNAATAGVKKRRLTPERARQLVSDFERVTIQELDVEVRRAVDLAIEHGLYAYDAYILEAARSSGSQLLVLDGAIKRSARKIGLPMVELER